jgi:hypothetical protein
MASIYGEIQASFPTPGSIQAALPPALEEVFQDIPDEQAKDYPGLAVAYPAVASLFSADYALSPFTNWYLETVYRWEEGLGHMPVAAPPSGSGGVLGVGVVPTPDDTNRQAAQIPRLSAPYGYMMVYWTGRRLQMHPLPPKPDPNNNQARFAAGELHISNPVVREDNTLIHTWTLAYLFLLLQPIWMLDTLNPGTCPAHNIPVEANTIQQQDFLQVY